MVVVSIRDSVAHCFNDVLFFRNDEVACRWFVNSVLGSRGSDSLIATNPNDYALWHLADFDELSGVFDGQEHFILMQANQALEEFANIFSEGDDSQDE